MHARFSQCAQLRHALPIQVFRHHVSGIDRATDLLDRELFVFLFLVQPEVLCFHVFDGVTTTAQSQLDRAAAASVQTRT